MSVHSVIPNFAPIAKLPPNYNNVGNPNKNFLKKQYKCCCKDGITADQVLTVLAAITIIATIVAVVFAIVFASNADSLQRFCVRATPQDVVSGPGEAGGLAVGTFSLYSNEREMGYEFLFENLSTITAIHIRGPIAPGGGQVGPFKFAVCGSPSTTVCDVTTTPGLVKGVLDQILPGGTSPRPEITAIRSNPSLYYLEFLTNDHPVTPGALRGNLYSTCGTP